MKRLMSVAIAVLALPFVALSAHAADVTPRTVAPVYKAPVQPQAFDWSGAYLGINGGYSFGRSTWNDPLAGGVSDRFNVNGGMVGGQLGYNWQLGNAVVGLETDIDWAKLSGSTSAGAVCAADGGGACRTEQSWLGTTRARLGYSFGNLMPYVTGGLAYGNVKALQTTGTSSATKTGWAVGAGVEYGINRNWSAKAEYMRIDLGTATFMGAASGSNSLSVPITEDIVRAGLNYRW